MKLGDHPEFEKLDSKSGKNSRGRDDNSSGVSGSMRIPEHLIFETFYTDEDTLKDELFFAAPKEVAEGFERYKLSASQFRMLYRGFEGFASALRDGRMSFPQAKPRFGSLYNRQVVRQHKRGKLPDVVKEFVDRHRDLILSSKREMLGFATYLENVYCYFDPNK